MVKNCIVCGREFEPVRPNQRCCSKECSHENSKNRCRRYNQQHKEAVSRTRKIWYEKNREHVLEYAKNYYRANKERCNERDREKYQENKKAILEKREYDRFVKPKMEACSKAHNGCFDCPTKDGECLYD